MKKDDDDRPTIDRTAAGLGVRPGVDIEIDENSDVAPVNQGMSVAPDWRSLELYCIPKRLNQIVPGARRSNNSYCFTIGSGPFQLGSFGQGLILVPDSEVHAVVAPETKTPFDRYEAGLSATRSEWTIDEN